MATDSGDAEDKFYKIPGQHRVDGMIFGPATKAEHLDRIKNVLELNEKDVISSSYYKTGSTWVNEIIFMIVNNADREKTLKMDVEDKLVFLEMAPPGVRPPIDVLPTLPSPRLIKTHLPMRYFKHHIDKLEAGPKVVVPTRNPKDTLVSAYHFYRMNPSLGLFPGTWDEFFELFRHKRLAFEEMFDFTATWWKEQEHPNVLIIKYEDIHADTPGAIHKIADFLGRPMTDEQVETILELTSFSHMGGDKFQSVKNQKWFDNKKSKFFRKGKIGDWRNYFNKEQSKYVDNLCKEMYEPIGLEYYYGEEEQ